MPDTNAVQNNRERTGGNERGVSLVEVMTALLVALLVFLALLQTALVGIDANMRNVLRDEAVNIADLRLNQARNTPFPALLDGTTTGSETRDVRNISGFTYTTTTDVVELDGDGVAGTDDANTKEIDVTITWTWKGEQYTHSTSTIRKR
ncbi:MAG: hypothetical protein ACOYVJ_03745 [Nitrospirota bacterium]